MVETKIKPLVVGISVLLLFLLLTGSNNLLKYAIICPLTEFLRENTTARKCLKNWLKLGILRQNKEGKYNDKSAIHLPWQYLPQHHGRERHDPSGQPTTYRSPLYHLLRCHQSGRDWQPATLRNCQKARTGRHPSYPTSCGADDSKRLPRIRLSHRYGQR